MDEESEERRINEKAGNNENIENIEKSGKNEKDETGEKNNEFVTKEMKVSEIINNYPESVPVLMGYGLHCIGCHLSNIDTLEEGAKIHSIDEETMELMIKDVNAVIKECKEDNKP